MVCFAAQWIGIQSRVNHDSIHQCEADSAILNGCSASRKVSRFHARLVLGSRLVGSDLRAWQRSGITALPWGQLFHLTKWALES